MDSHSHYFRPHDPGSRQMQVVQVWVTGRSIAWTVAPGTFASGGLDRGTLLLLSTLKMEQNQLLLDVGCGTGALGLLPHLDGDSIRSILVDINPVAARCALANARLHRIDRALIVVGSCADAVATGQVDVVVTNPPIRAGRKTVEGILRGALTALKPGGWFHLVVRVRQGGWTLASILERWLSTAPELLERDKGYLVFRVRKPLTAIDLSN